jgi:hypothetical protein
LFNEKGIKKRKKGKKIKIREKLKGKNDGFLFPRHRKKDV